MAVTAGIFILVWLVSGIVMIVPPLSAGPARQRAPAADFPTVTMSPAEAIASLAKLLGATPQVHSVSLRRIAGMVVYEIAAGAGGSHMIDARTGRLFTITPQVAERVARHDFPTQANVRDINLVTRHTFAYLWGPLPAYRIAFDDDRATVSYVSTSDGTVRRNDRRGRIRSAITSLHQFEPLKLVIEGNAVRKALLFLLSAVGIGVAGTGYYLALSRPQR
jgi:hypothetical protein